MLSHWMGLGSSAGAEFVEPFGGVGELGVELDGDFGADFVTAAADGGADGGEQVGGPGFEVHLHLADGFDGDAGEGAAPIRRERRLRRGFWGRRGGWGRSRQSGHRGGGRGGWWRRRLPCRAGGGRVEEMDDVGMDLLEGDELEVAGTECGLEAAAVFEDVVASVPIREAEI